VVQGIFFADGGLSALGLNVFNMGVIGALGGYAVYVLLMRVLPAGRASVPIAAGIAAGISVVLAALGFSLQYLLGGEGGVDAGTVTAAMVGVHVLIGIGEGLITALVVGAVMATRPDLVAGASLAREEAVHG
jgi:cobalt/nickel transport system permease protein